MRAPCFSSNGQAHIGACNRSYLPVARGCFLSDTYRKAHVRHPYTTQCKLVRCALHVLSELTQKPD
ncbi:hypothetical protein HMPREF3190_01553 [Umbribacter vaginalis]|nr:hypothetical protein HMPREF3190_01553 [Coriobacteriales bacterium DNF00809]